MKLIVGLGNIGEKYQLTRHNIGFIIVDEYAEFKKVEFKFDKQLEAMIAEFRFKDEKIIVAKPTTFMNLSGNAVSKIMNYYKIPINDVLVIYDDKDLEVGRLRVRETNGHGGHNGIRDIINHLNSKDFKRIRVGIGLDKSMPLDQYVLGRFSKNDIDQLKPIVIDAISIIDDFISDIYFKDIMTKYNTQT